MTEIAIVGTGTWAAGEYSLEIERHNGYQDVGATVRLLGKGGHVVASWSFTQAGADRNAAPEPKAAASPDAAVGKRAPAPDPQTDDWDDEPPPRPKRRFGR